MARYEGWNGSLEERILRQVEKTDYCWEWTGYKRLGYARISTKGKSRQAHRELYKLTYPDLDITNLHLHHKCANRGCVNPEHLEPITQSANMGEMHARMSYEKRIAQLEEEVARLKYIIEKEPK